MASKKEDNFWKNFKRDFIAGSASGAAVALGTHALDTKTVRAQNKGKGYNSAFRAVDPRKTKLKGASKVKDLYSGMGPRLAKTIAAGAIGYPVFMATADALEKKGSVIKYWYKSPVHLESYTHSDEVGKNEFRQADPMPTTKGIQHMSKAVIDRPGALGTRKFKSEPTELSKQAAFALATKIPNFIRGMIGMAPKGTWKSKSYLGGIGTVVGGTSMKAPTQATSLEKAVKARSGFTNVPTLRNMNPTANKFKFN